MARGAGATGAAEPRGGAPWKLWLVGAFQGPWHGAVPPDVRVGAGGGPWGHCCEHSLHSPRIAQVRVKVSAGLHGSHAGPCMDPDDK